MVYKKINLPPVPHDKGEAGWRIDAACKDADVEMFFHPDQQRGNRRKNLAEQAIQICKGCTVLEECRDYAIKSAEEYGIWGGMTQEQLGVEVKNYRREMAARSDEEAAS